MSDRLRVGIITQEDPFYLAEAIRHFLSHLPGDEVAVVVAVVFPGSPFGKRLSVRDQCVHTLKVFGPTFFLHYGLRWICSKLDARQSVAKTLRSHRIPTITDITNLNQDAAIARVMQHEPALLVCVGGNQIFKSRVLRAAPEGMLNLHTSLLPKYRGLMPTFWVLKNGEKETGVSVFRVDEGIDSGDILVQKRVEIGDQSQSQLIRDTKRIGAEALIEAIMAIKTKTAAPMPNPDESSTYYPFPTREDVREFYRNGKRFF